MSFFPRIFKAIFISMPYLLTMNDVLRFSVFTFFALLIGIVDFLKQKIPDILLLILLSALVTIDYLSPLTGAASPPVIRALTAVIIFGLFCAVYHIRGGLGFGDVKYAAVIAYFLGPFKILPGLLLAVFSGLIYWGFGHFIFGWKKEKRFAFGPWLGLGAIIAGLIKWSVV